MRTTNRDIKGLMREVRDKPTLPKYKAGRVIGWGRRATDQAARNGQMPIIDGPRPVVPTSWIRKQLGIETEA
jgi:hypothetical protein